MTAPTSIDEGAKDKKILDLENTVRDLRKRLNQVNI